MVLLHTHKHHLVINSGMLTQERISNPKVDDKKKKDKRIRDLLVLLKGDFNRKRILSSPASENGSTSHTVNTERESSHPKIT